jgi:hypothetical protein
LWGLDHGVGHPASFSLSHARRDGLRGAGLRIWNFGGTGQPNALAEALLNMLQNQALRLSIANNEYITVVKRCSSEKTGSLYEALFADLVDSLKIDDYSSS